MRGGGDWAELGERGSGAGVVLRFRNSRDLGGGGEFADFFRPTRYASKYSFPAEPSPRIGAYSEEIVPVCATR